MRLKRVTHILLIVSIFYMTALLAGCSGGGEDFSSDYDIIEGQESYSNSRSGETSTGGGVEGGFLMWYGYYSNGDKVGLATSPDGVTWSKSPSNPVLNSAYMPSVVYDGSSYKMWYSYYSSGDKIGLATSPDGVTWSKSPSNPVLSSAYIPWVVFDGSIYKMWYGYYSSGDKIGLATSPDGVTWSKSPSNPVLSGAYWQSVIQQ